MWLVPYILNANAAAPLLIVAAMGTKEGLKGRFTYRITLTVICMTKTVFQHILMRQWRAFKHYTIILIEWNEMKIWLHYLPSVCVAIFLQTPPAVVSRPVWVVYSRSRRVVGSVMRVWYKTRQMMRNVSHVQHHDLNLTSSNRRASANY